MRVIVTRPRLQAEAQVAALRAAGIDARSLPLIAIGELADPLPLRRAWSRLEGYAMAMFVSANAVHHFMRQRPAGTAWPEGVLAASTGPGTSAALREAGVPARLLVEPAGETFDSEALWAALGDRDWRGRRALVLRGEQGRDWLADRLGEAGASVEFLAAYTRAAHRPDSAQRTLLAQALDRPEDHLWLFSSSQAVDQLDSLGAGADWSRSLALATHPRIAARVRRLGFARVDLAAPRPDALARQIGSLSGPP